MKKRATLSKKSQEFIPRGRRVVEEHPGTLARKHDYIPNEFMLLDRMQNVNLSKDEHFHENWTIREIYEHSPISESDLGFLHPATVNSEEELYFRGNTAVWSRGLSDAQNEKASSEICYTSEGPIQFAFFCTKNFLDADYKIGGKQLHEIDSSQGVGVIDTSSLKVFSSNGETLYSAFECPTSKIWITKYCIVVDKEPSSTGRSCGIIFLIYF